MLGDSSLRIGCARSGMGWMMMWLGARSVNAFKRKLDLDEEREGVFLSTCFFPLLMAIQGDLLLEAWMDPGNPGNPGQ